MTQLKRQIIAVLATGSMALSAVSPAFAATSLTITGNGSSSDNDIKMETSTNTTVVQSNEAKVTNNVSSDATTGGNKANDNTGGDVMIRTGNATSETTVQNTLNSNSATVDCCDQGDVTVEISGNGTKSDNEVKLESGDRRSEDKTEIFQNNKADVKNNVDTNSTTGGNDTNRNTGGDVTIRTGDAMATSDVSTTANVNQARIGGGNGEEGELSVRIANNGSYSDNEVELDLSRETTIVQDNEAKVRNYVDATAKTGWNDANDNTSGEVLILTGDAEATAVVDNMVNFNAADVDCGCLLDVEAKIAGNGTDSENEIEAELGDEVEVFQGGKEGNGNNAYLHNDVDAEAKTGANDSTANTGSEEGSDPFIWTGDAESTTEVSNVGNSNVYGGDWEMEFPEVDFNFNVSLTLSQLAALLVH